MNTFPHSLASLPPRRLVSLRWRLCLAVPAANALVVGLLNWDASGLESVQENLTRNVWLTTWLSAVQLLLIEALLWRPLRRLAASCEAMESVPLLSAPQDDAPLPGVAVELDRIGRVMWRARALLFEKEQEAQKLKRELAFQRSALEQTQVALEASQHALTGLARTDELTGLANRRAFDEALRREFKRAQRQCGPLALAVLDLDLFKQYNQQHGQAAGDQALQRVAALLCERFKRDTDVVARLGGEEFVALLPGFGTDEAQGMLEALREELRGLFLAGADGEVALTISVGLAAMSPARPYLSAQALMDAADEALHMAKHSGRDRLSLAA